MKTLTTIAFIIIQSFLMWAQTQPEAFISKIPALPNDPCLLDDADKQAYLNKLQELIDELEAETKPRKEKIEAAYKNSKPQIEKNIQQESGLSDSDIQKLKSKKLSKEEKKKIADKVMQEKMNMSMQEIENLKKLSKEGKEAWVEAYATEQMATMEGNQDNVNAVNEKNMNIYELAKEQSELAQRIAAEDQRFANKFKELDVEDSVATKLLVKRDKIMSELQNYSGEEYVQKVKEVLKLEFDYCSLMYPKHFAILDDHLNSLKSLQTTYFKLEKVNAQLNEATLNVKNPDFYSPGLMGLEAVSAHLGMMKDLFKYAKYSFPYTDLLKR